MAVQIDEQCWTLLYIQATNYRFYQDDVVSWDDEHLFWHTEDRTIAFNLMTAGAIQ